MYWTEAHVSSGLGADFEAAQLEAEGRAFGAELYQSAAAISEQTVEAVAAALSAVESRTRGRLPREVAVEFARQMMSEAALQHRTRL